MKLTDQCEFARFILTMPEDLAITYLRAIHNTTCNCGCDGGPDGPFAGPRLMLDSLRAHWAGRL